MRISGSTIDLKSFALASMMVIAGFSPGTACATLGEPEASVQTDVAQFKGSVKATDHASYRLHEIQLPAGTTLREFASLDGNVFAVAWGGPTAPNLRQALGRYFDNFVTAAKVTRSDHHHLQIQQGDLVVQVSGHMRAFTGRAYLPQAIPAGVSLGDLH
jgi:hypothetical protein